MSLATVPLGQTVFGLKIYLDELGCLGSEGESVLVLFRDRALGGNLFVKSIVHGNYQFVCSVIADKTGCGNGYVALAIVGSACNCRSLNSSPVCSSRLFNSATGGNCDLYLVVIVVVSNTTEVVCTCFGKFKSRYIRFVLFIPLPSPFYCKIHGFRIVIVFFLY